MTTLTMLVWVAGFMVLPALPAAWVMARGLRSGVTAVPLISFALAVAVTTVVSIASWMFGLRLVTTIVWYFVLLLAIDAWFLLRAGRPRRLPVAVDVPAIAAAMLAGVLAIWERTWMAPNMDVFYHLAAARSLQYYDAGFVTDPFYGIGNAGVDPTTGAFNVILGLAARCFGIDPAGLWTGFNLLVVILAPAAFWMLMRQLRVSYSGAALATFALTFLSSAGDLRFAAYPNRVGVTLMILAIAACVAITRSRRAGLSLAFFASLAAAGSHTGVALATLTAAGTLAGGTLVYAWWIRRSGWRTGRLVPRVLIAAAILSISTLAALAPRLWFVFNAPGSDGIHIPNPAGGIAQDGLYRLGGVGLFYDPQASFNGGLVLVLFGATLAIWCLREAARRRDHVMALGAIVSLLPVVVGFNPVVTPILVAVSPYVTWRVLNLLWFAPYVAIALAWRRKPELARLAVIGALLATLPSLHMLFSDDPVVAVRPGVRNLSIWQGWEFDIRKAEGGEAIGELRRFFGDEWPLVATDEMTGYNIVGLVPCRTVAVTAVHAPSFLELKGEGARRRRHMEALFAEGTPAGTRRWYVEEYKPDYLLFWPGRITPKARLEIVQDREMYRVVYDNHGVAVLEVLHD